MPYKDKEKARLYYERHKNFYDRKYIIENRKDWNEYQNEYKKNKRKELGYDKYYQEAKKNPLKAQRLNKSSKNWRDKNIEYMRLQYKKKVDSLSDDYIAKQLAKSMFGAKKNDIKKDKELIQLSRANIKLKRLIKWKKQLALKTSGI